MLFYRTDSFPPRGSLFYRSVLCPNVPFSLTVSCGRFVNRPYGCIIKTSIQNAKHFYNEIPIKIRDMRVDFYTLDVRNLGQAEGAHKVGASARTSRKTTETLAFRVESVATLGSPFLVFIRPLAYTKLSDRTRLFQYIPTYHGTDRNNGFQIRPRHIHTRSL